ncbi:hypothetical protein AURDEDRAFT_173525 [Auricularia subglabra TFB-10046 SS5]|nr:hypothetical protein AURDEDRAFT_173525 [Auricularia subglabra TFB-10046 SS5]
MPPTDSLPRPATAGSAALQKKRKTARRGSRSRSSRLPQKAGYYPAALTTSNLALADALHAPPARNGGPAPATTATDDAVTCSDAPDPSPAPHISSARPRLVIRIPSLAARRALAAQPPPSAAPPAPQKRPRSPTPDSDEDEFAASFMRKRRVAAAWL